MRQTVTAIKESHVGLGRCPQLVHSARHVPATQRHTLISYVCQRRFQVHVTELEMIKVLDGFFFLDVVNAL